MQLETHSLALSKLKKNTRSSLKNVWILTWKSVEVSFDNALKVHSNANNNFLNNLVNLKKQKQQEGEKTSCITVLSAGDTHAPISSAPLNSYQSCLPDISQLLNNRKWFSIVCISTVFNSVGDSKYESLQVT